MPRQYKKRKQAHKQQCPCCLHYFARLSTHYNHNQRCAKYVVNKDTTVLTDINQLQNDNENRHENNVNENLPLNNDTFALHHINDQDIVLFDTTLDSSTSDNDNYVNETELSSESDSDNENSKDSSISIFDGDQTQNDINNNNYSSTLNESDFHLQTMIESEGSDTNNKTINGSSQSSTITSYFDMRKHQINVLKQMILLPVDNSIIASIKLLKIMNDGHIASTHYKSIIEWFNETTQSTAISDSTSRTSLIKSKKKIISMLHGILYQQLSPELSMKPIHNVMKLPSNHTTKISKMNLVASLFSLLTDPQLMIQDNLLIYDNEYLQPSKSTSTHITDIHHSTSFQEAHQNICKDPHDVLVPIIPFIDGTPIDVYGRNKLEVLMYTLGIFNQSTRNKPISWRVAGYIPDPTNSNSGEHNDNDVSHMKKAIEKRIDYHEMLKYLLNDFVELEKSDGILINLPNKTNTDIITYRFKFVILYIIGDAVGNDKLCDRYVSYGKKVKRLCRDCDCPTDKLDSHKHQCTFTKRSDLLKMNEKELKEISYYKIHNNALDKLSFGGNEYGMNACLPPEPLHQLNQGVFKKLVDYFDDCLTKVGKETIDKFVRYLSMNSHRQSTRDYPDIGLFKDGIDKCQLTGSEIITKVFMLYICLCQTYVIECLPTIEEKVKPRFKTQKTKTNQHHIDIECMQNDNPHHSKETVTTTKVFYKKIGHSRSHLKDWIKLFEATLCFDAWINQDTFDMKDLKETHQNDSKADIAIRAYMKLYTKMIDEKLGNGTKTSKVHWMLHIPRYIRMHGPPKAYSGQTPEHCLSPLVKWAARMTQLRPESLIQQSCERYYETHIIDRSYELLKQQNVVNSLKPSSTSIELQLKQKLYDDNIRSYVVIGRYRIHFDDNHNFTKLVWKQGRSSAKSKYIHPNKTIINDLITRLHTNEYGLQSNYIDCFTTLHTMHYKNKTKEMYRADSYFYKRPWNDWCESMWDSGSSQRCYPCRLLMFVDTTNMRFEHFYNKQHPYLALVRASEPDVRTRNTRKNKDCLLIESFESDQYVRLINCGTIVKPLFVCPDVHDIVTENKRSKYLTNHRIKLKDKNEWPKYFIQMSWQ